MKKRIVLCMALAMVVLIGSTVSSFASISTVVLTPKRTGNTTATAKIYSSFTVVATTCKATMTLQQKSGSTWKSVSGKTYSTSSKGVKSIGLYKTLSLTKGKVYRVKATFNVKKGTSSWTKTYYSNSF